MLDILEVGEVNMSFLHVFFTLSLWILALPFLIILYRIMRLLLETLRKEGVLTDMATTFLKMLGMLGAGAIAFSILIGAATYFEIKQDHAKISNSAASAHAPAYRSNKN